MLGARLSRPPDPVPALSILHPLTAQFYDKNLLARPGQVALHSDAAGESMTIVDGCEMKRNLRVSAFEVNF